MTTLALQASLPWSGSDEEDRRFRWILLQTLLLCLAAAVIAAYIHIPEPDISAAADFPPPRVRLLAELPRPESQPQPQPQPQPEPEPRPLPVPVAVAEPPQPPTVPAKAPRVTPRQKAASSGVLAMSAALAELQGATPNTGKRSGADNATGRVHAPPPQPSMLTANVTRGSQGDAGGVTHEAVMGASSLPDREQEVLGTAGSDVGLPADKRAAVSPPGPGRSEESIQEVLDRNKGAMYTLYNRALRRDAGLQGKLVMNITIAPAGNVTRCVILDSKLASVSLEQQLVALIKRIDFGNKPGAATVTTKIPIEFFPR